MKTSTVFKLSILVLLAFFVLMPFLTITPTKVVGFEEARNTFHLHLGLKLGYLHSATHNLDLGFDVGYLSALECISNFLIMEAITGKDYEDQEMLRHCLEIGDLDSVYTPSSN